MLHLFEKLKYIVVIANKSYRNDKHYGFNLWRSSCRTEKKLSNVLEITFNRVIPLHLIREYVKRWNSSARILKRVQIAAILLTEFETIKYFSFNVDNQHAENGDFKSFIMKNDTLKNASEGFRTNKRLQKDRTTKSER
jgi:hypothetical protein